MTEAVTAPKKDIQFNVNDERGRVTIGNAEIEVSSDGKKISAYAPDGFEVKAATRVKTNAEGTRISVNDDLNIVVLNGVTIELAADDHLIITAPGGTVVNKPAPANDTALKSAKEAFEPGAKLADGSVYAGKTEDGRLILAMPKDLDVTMTFNEAAKAVKALNNNNSFGHDDWQIPTLDMLNALQKNRDEGFLKDTFRTTLDGRSPSYPDWYWSSTEYHAPPSDVLSIRISDGIQTWDHKGSDRLSCRPVRIVAASDPSLRR